MKILKKLILFIVCTGLIFSIKWGKVNASEEKLVEIKATYGVDSLVKNGESCPIVVEVDNKEDDVLKGTIEVIVPNSVGSKDSINQNVEIEGKEKRNFYIPANIGNYNDRIKVRFIKSGNIVDEKEILINKDNIAMMTTTFFGVLSDDNSVDYLNEFSGEDGPFKENGIFIKRSKCAKLSIDILESDVKNFNSIDIIVINNFDTSKLNKKAVENLNKWIKNGGTLILGGTENTINNTPKELIDEKIYGYTEKYIDIENDKGVSLNLGVLDGKNGDEETKYGDNLVAKKYKLDNGRIIVTTFSLSSESFKGFNEKESILTKILSKKDKNFNPGILDVGSSGGNFSETILFAEDFPIPSIIFATVIYIIAIGFGGYFILKKLHKRELAWITIPLISIIFTVIIGNIANKTSINDMVQVQINKVNIDDNGNGNIDTTFSIANKYKRDLIIENPSDYNMKYLDRTYASSGSGEGSDLVNLRMNYDGKNIDYEFNKLSALEFKNFYITGKKDKFNKVEGTLKYLDNTLSGSLKNNLGTDIKEGYIVFGNIIWKVESMRKGQSMELNKLEAISSDGVGNGFRDVNLKNYKSLDKNEENKNIKSRVDILDYATRGLDPSKLYIISINEDSIDYGFKFNSEDIKKISKSIYINELKLDLKDNEGNIVYPPNMIKKINISNNSFGVEVIGDTINSSEEFVLGYTLPENFKANNIKINLNEEGIPWLDNSKGQNRYSLYNKEIQVYNFTTGKFDDFKLEQNKQLIIEKVDNYIKNGQFQIKYFGNDPVINDDPKDTIYYISRIPDVSLIGGYNNANN